MHASGDDVRKESLSLTEGFDHIIGLKRRNDVFLLLVTFVLPAALFIGAYLYVDNKIAVACIWLVLFGLSWFFRYDITILNKTQAKVNELPAEKVK